MKKIGFIGVGVMGMPMASNLLRKGYSVSIIGRHPEREVTLIAQGACTADSPQELARVSDVMILMLPDTNTVEQVLFGDQGLALGIRTGATVIDMSTISPEKAIEFAERLARSGCPMLDAPVSGGQKGAEAGTLGIMAGGPRDVFETCRPILEAMGKTITYTGASGNGQKTKLVNQLVGATNLLGAVEGLRLARAAGLDAHTTLEAVSSGAASSWMVVNLGPRILQGDFAPGFSIRLQHKDLSLLTDWLARIGGDFPAADLVYSLYHAAMAAGLENQGNQGLINLWNAGTHGHDPAALSAKR
jgi:3-hydroxyisobutyrate dehydrogenase-like beta-hydroxyacid dehydrogenase